MSIMCIGMLGRSIVRGSEGTRCVWLRWSVKISRCEEGWSR
jgi:hypothetical protein